MELCLENLDRNIWMKEVQVSECFAKETMVLSRLMGEFAKNSTVMNLVAKYFDLRAEWDGDIVRRLQLRKIQKEKTSELNDLLDEYNSLPNSYLERKLGLGNKIKSLKLELNKVVKVQLDSLDARLGEIKSEVNSINSQLKKIQAGVPMKEQELKQDLLELGAVSQSLMDECGDAREEFNAKYEETMKRFKFLPDFDVAAVQ